MADSLPRPETAFRTRTAQEPFESGDGRPLHQAHETTNSKEHQK